MISAPKNAKTREVITIIAFVLSLLCAGYNIYTLIQAWTAKPGERVETTLGTTFKKPEKRILSATVNSDGDLIVSYTDKTTTNAGHVVGADGKDGVSPLGPSTETIKEAVDKHCKNNPCTSIVSSEQIAAAVANYCKGGRCRGDNGKSVSASDIADAVTAYCKDGRCVGPAGANGKDGTNGADGVSTPGQDGKDGVTPILKCVEPSPTATISELHVSTDGGATFKKMIENIQGKCS